MSKKQDETKPQTDGKKPYHVGYKLPPAGSRFKPGDSGNPGGRKKGLKNFASDLRATLQEPVTVKQGGRPRRMSTQQAMLARAREKALSGDLKAILRFFELSQRFNNEPLAEASAEQSKNDAELLATWERLIVARYISDNEPFQLSSDTAP